MHTLEILVMAVALAMDAFAVSIATGLAIRCSLVQTLRMSLTFGLFQFIMPVIGWFAGATFRSAIEAFDHWVAFILLALIGCKMIKDALSEDDGEKCADPTKGITLIVLAVATSIDALAVGVSMAILKVDVWVPSAVIGVVCFIISATGIYLGRSVIREGSSLARKANIVGGIVLLLIAVKILLEHGVFEGI